MPGTVTGPKTCNNFSQVINKTHSRFLSEILSDYCVLWIPPGRKSAHFFVVKVGDADISGTHGLCPHSLCSCYAIQLQARLSRCTSCPIAAAAKTHKTYSKTHRETQTIHKRHREQYYKKTWYMKQWPKYNTQLDSLRSFFQRRSRTPHLGGGVRTRGLWPPTLNSAETFVQCT